MCLGWDSGSCVCWALARSGFWSCNWLIGCGDSWHTGYCWSQGGCDVGLGGQLSDVSEGIIDCVSRSCCLAWEISPQELVLAKGDSTGSINTYHVLVKLADLNVTPVLCRDVDLSDFDILTW